MILRGYFDHHGRPRLRGAAVFPRFGRRGVVEFLVDTGADASVLSLPDGLRILQSRMAELVDARDFTGGGGSLSC